MKSRVSFCCFLFLILIPWIPSAAFSNSTGHPSQVELAVEEKDIRKIIEDHVRMAISDPGKRVEIRGIRGFERFVLPPGRVSHEVTTSPYAYRGGNASFNVTFFVDGKEAKKVRLTAQVDIFANVVVAKSAMKRHHLVGVSDLQIAERNIASLPPDVVTDPQELIGKRTTLSVNSHEVLRRSMFERNPIVRKGNRITLLIENDFFRITALGEVLEEGGKGDRVKLLNVSSKREVYGRIIDENTAQIDY